MIEKLNHFPVNWVDGMKINKNHFIEMQNYIYDTNRDAIGVELNMINYGLLPVENLKDSVKISLVIDNHKLLRVKVDECHAVTPNGTRIEISPENTHTLHLESPYPEATYNLSNGEEITLLANIVVSQDEKIPFGNPDPEESPPRYPYLIPTYKLNLVEEDNNNQYQLNGYQLTIGKIEINREGTQLKASYIPPCTSVSSHQLLKDQFNEIDRFFGQMELYSVQIIQKINTKTHNNQLAVMVEELCDKLLMYFGQTINEFRWMAKQSVPAYMLDKVVAQGRVMKNFIDSKAGNGKEELLNYFAEWCRLSQAEFESMCIDLVNVGYNHKQIDVTIDAVNHFMITIEELFSALNRLDYIGKRQDTGIFVKERSEDDALKNKRNKSFLAD